MKKISFLLPTLFFLNFGMAIRTSSGGVNPLPAIDQILTFTENKGQLTDLKGNLRPDILFCSMQKGMNIYIKNNSIIWDHIKEHSMIWKQQNIIDIREPRLFF